MKKFIIISNLIILVFFLLIAGYAASRIFSPGNLAMMTVPAFPQFNNENLSPDTLLGISAWELDGYHDSAVTIISPLKLKQSFDFYQSALFLGNWQVIADDDNKIFAQKTNKKIEINLSPLGEQTKIEIKSLQK